MRRFTLFSFSIIIISVAALVPLQWWFDGQTGNRVAEESLYLPSGKSVKQLSVGFDGLLSDVYWIRAVQYFGYKALNGGIDMDSKERFDLLYPLLDITTTLDPQYIIAYEFGGMFIADYNSSDKAIKLLERGIQQNPQEWRLQQYLGMIYWHDHDYQKASEVFQQGANVPGAPPFMRAMAAQVLAEGGSRKTARQLFTQVYESADDKQIKSAMAAKLDRLQALDQIDCLRRIVDVFHTRAGRYPPGLNLRALEANLGNDFRDVIKDCSPDLKLNITDQRLAVDPAGFPFAYNKETGEIAIADKSTIQKR